MCFLWVSLSVMLLAQAGSLAERAALAKEALLGGDAAGAVAGYWKLVKELPRDPGMRLNLALALESAGDYAQEIEQLNIVVRQQPAMSAAWLLLGMARQKSGQPGAAIQPLERALAGDPGNAIARLELADAFLASQQYQQAADLFRQIVDQDPRSAKGWQGLGLSYAGLAQAEFTKLDATAQHSAEWCLLAGRSELNQEHYTRAFALFREALNQQPDLAAAHEGLAQVYEKTGHADWAAIETRKAESSGRPPVSAGLRRSEDYQSRSRAALERLAQLPESAEILELTAEANQRQGRRADALALWRRACELAPRDQRLAGRLAESLWLNRSYEEAAQLLQPLVAAKPQSAQLQYLLGDVMFRQQQSEAALPHLQEAVRLNPGLLAAHAVLGRIYLQMGDARKAIPHLRKGLPVDEAAIWFQLGQAYRKTGQATLADQAFQHHQAMSPSQTPLPGGEAITAPTR